MKDVIEVLSKLASWGFKISPKKANLFKQSLIFLGFLLRRGTINIPDQRIQGFLDIPPPSSRLGLRKFINSLSFFPSNIPNFAELTVDLAELVNKSDRKKKGCIPFKFLPEHLEKFESLKTAIKKCLPLHDVNFEKPIYTFSDASKRSISFVAFQLDTDDDKWFKDETLTDAQKNEKVIAAVMSNNEPKKFVFCSSRKLTKSERNYSVFKLELLSLNQGLLSAKAPFSFASIKAFVDARSILYVRMCRSSSDQIARMAIFLSSFDLELYHVPSRVNFLSDYLSRIAEVDDDQEGDDAPRAFTEKESNLIIQQLTLPQTLVLSSDIVNKMLSSDSVKINLPNGKQKGKGTARHFLLDQYAKL